MWCRKAPSPSTASALPSRAGLIASPKSPIIPYTYSHTNLCERKPGDPVNLEGDILGKYIEQHMEARNNADKANNANNARSRNLNRK